MVIAVYMTEKLSVFFLFNVILFYVLENPYIDKTIVGLSLQ